MFRKYDMIRAFDAGSYSYFFSASKGEILSFSHFLVLHHIVQYLQKLLLLHN